MHEIISKKQAKELGLKHFFTGMPCKNGHIDRIFVSSGSCFSCEIEKGKARRKLKLKCPSYDKKLQRLKDEGFYRTDEYRAFAKERRERLSKDPEQREKQRAYSKKYREKYPEKIHANSIARRNTEEKAQKQREAERKYYKENAERIKPIKNLASRNARKNNIKKRLECSMRSAFKRIFKMASISKDLKTFETLGYTADQLKTHIEKQFNKKMSWDNYASYWEIDHIIPVSDFFKRDILDPKVINRLTNLRPLECSKNRSKQAKIEFLL